ncbi:MAG TPA: hypothetical protein VGM56_24315 [Byssovorax sp.]|jgi:hypothetical protein
MLPFVAPILMATTLGDVVPRADDPHRFTVDLRGVPIATAYEADSFGWGLHLGAHYHVAPWLRVGALVGLTTVTPTASDVRPWYGVSFTIFHVAAHAEAHVLPSHLFDPWIGAGVGLFAVQPDPDPVVPPGGAGLELSADVGLDVHVHRRVTVGVVYMLAAPVTNGAAFGLKNGFGHGWTFSGLAEVPIPAARVAVSF